MSAVIGFAPDGTDDDVTRIEFLEDLHHLGDDKVVVIWDGPPGHRSRAMKARSASQCHWLVVEQEEHSRCGRSSTIARTASGPTSSSAGRPSCSFARSSTRPTTPGATFATSSTGCTWSP
jgi:hypothetical protein